jgi:hypothetical protein
MWQTGARRVAVVLACAAAASARPVASAQSPGLDACAVLTREEIKALSGNHDPGPAEPGTTKGVVTNCYWQRTSPNGSVSLWSNVDPNEPRGLALKQLLDHGKKARAVAGLGDDAIFVESPPDDPGGTLFVRVGHWRVVIFRQANAGGASASVLPTLTAFAKVAIPKLRRAG